MKNTTVILVHGAFADGSSWGNVIPLLERDGYEVIAVQNPLTSFADDVATTRRVIDAQPGPVVLVGHSYGGAVITSAAVGVLNVKAPTNSRSPRLGSSPNAVSAASSFAPFFNQLVMAGELRSFSCHAHFTR